MSDWTNGVVQLLEGDARRVLAGLPAESVHCVVTSPPYWGLRDYGLEPLVWGGDDGHEHEWDEESYQRRSNDGGKSPKQASNAGANGRDEPILHAVCVCGAWRGSLGLEPTIDLYVAHVVELFREVRRALRKDGTLWLNMGDTYAAGTHCAASFRRDRAAVNVQHPIPRGLKPKDLCMMPARVALALQTDGWWLRSDIVWSKPNPMPESVTDRPTRAHEYVFLLAKGQRSSRTVKLANLSDQPAHLSQSLIRQNAHLGADELCIRLASALTDCPQLQEYIRLPLLDAEVGANSADNSDSDTIVSLPSEHRALANAASRLLSSNLSAKEFLQKLQRFGLRLGQGNVLIVGRTSIQLANTPGIYADGEGTIAVQDSGEVCKFDFQHGQIISVWPTTCNYFYDTDAIREPNESVRERGRPNGHATWESFGHNTSAGTSSGGRNKRSVWEIAAEPYPEAHFATFPEKFVEPCILAGTSERGVCPECGGPWERVVEVREEYTEWAKTQRFYGEGGKGSAFRMGKTNSAVAPQKQDTTGWRPTCDCGHEETTPATVLDPFAGSGTVAYVAQRLGRRSIGIDLSAEYLELAAKRLEGLALPMGLVP
jgi:DNA modification methylase